MSRHSSFVLHALIAVFLVLFTLKASALDTHTGLTLDPASTFTLDSPKFSVKANTPGTYLVFLTDHPKLTKAIAAPDFLSSPYGVWLHNTDNHTYRYIQIEYTGGLAWINKEYRLSGRDLFFHDENGSLIVAFQSTSPDEVVKEARVTYLALPNKLGDKLNLKFEILLENGKFLRGSLNAPASDMDPPPRPPKVVKPVIYLYPTEAQKVKVALNYKGTLDTTYPPYDPALHGWSALAHPDGTLINDADGREYSYLFWDGKGYDFPVNLQEGFVVKGRDTARFLQTSLAQLGLTPKEYNEFIVYWLPQMQHNPYNFIRFAGKEYTDIAPLTITPTPDAMLRVFMMYKPLQAPMRVKEQVLRGFQRHGFTVVEWGGSEIGR